MIASAVPVSLDQLHASFLSIMPRIETHARVFFRDIKCSQRKADYVSEAIALAWKWFYRLAECGKNGLEFPMVLADYAARHVRAGRRLCGQEKGKDVMSAVAQQRHGFKVESLPLTCRSHERLYGKPCAQRIQDTYEEQLRDDTQTPIPDQVAFRLDFPEWLATLSYRDQRVVKDLALGHRTMEVAKKHGLSPGRVSQLREQFRKAWLMFVGELPVIHSPSAASA